MSVLLFNIETTFIVASAVEGIKLANEISKNEEIKNINVISTWIDGRQVNHSAYTWKNLKLILFILFNYINTSIKEWFI